MSAITQILSKYNIPARGIVHVGGDGSEIAEYIAAGFKLILYIESNAAKFEKVAEAARRQVHVMGIRVRVGNANGYEMVDGKLEAVWALDSLLVHLRKQPAEFNVLNLANLKSPERYEMDTGAEHLIKGLDIIFPAISPFFECGMERMEGAYIRRPSLNLWEKPHGRFANEIFQHFFATLLCDHHEMTLRTPPWSGNQLFGIHDEFPREHLPEIAEHDPRPEKSDLWHSLSPNRFNGVQIGSVRDLSLPTPRTPYNSSIFGNFQFHTGLFTAEQRSYFRDLYTPVTPLSNELHTALFKMMGANKTLVCVHVRRGDYEDKHPGMFYRTPVASYLKWLDEIWPLLESPLLYVCSDDPGVAAEFEKYAPRTMKDMAITLNESFYVDFWVMTQAHALAISNSSYSFAAAMLNDRPEGSAGTVSVMVPTPTGVVPRFWRPLRNGIIQSFNPWNADPLLGRYDAPAFPSSEQMVDEILAKLLPGLDPQREGAVIEVGCGTFGWTFNTLARIGYRCHAIEPMPTEELLQACQQTGTSFTKAVMSEMDGDRFFDVGRDQNVGSLNLDWWGASGVIASVTSICLRSFLARALIQRISVLKIDVEGAEETIIRQLQNIPTEQLPKVVVFEYGGTPRKEGKGGWTAEAMTNTARCIEILHSLGYPNMTVVENHREPRMVINSKDWKQDKWFDDDADYGNIVAVLMEPALRKLTEAVSASEIAGEKVVAAQAQAHDHFKGTYFGGVDAAAPAIGHAYDPATKKCQYCGQAETFAAYTPVCNARNVDGAR